MKVRDLISRLEVDDDSTEKHSFGRDCKLPCSQKSNIEEK